MNKFFSILMFLTVLSFSANADITRNCYASFGVYIKDGLGNADVYLASIVGRGSCQNQIFANKCRENGRKALNTCLNDTWDNRNVNAIQPSCNSIINGSSHSGAKLTWDGIIPIEKDNQLVARAAFEVCCVKRKYAANVTVQFGGRITGDTKCASTKIGNNLYQDEFAFSDYQFQCANLRQQGLCN